jgi:ribose transport system substrate-binding protein
MKPRIFLIAALFALVFGSISGCGNPNQSSNSANPNALRIAVIPKGATHEFWKSIHAGANKAAKELGVEIVWQSPQKEDDRQQQIQVMQNMISQGVSAIVLAPLDSKALVPSVETATNRNIPVVIIDSALESDKQVSFVATDNFLGGKLCAKQLGEALNGTGKVIMLRNAEGAASTIAREEGFLEGIKAYPNIQVLNQDQYAGVTMEKALQTSQNLLNRFGKVDGAFASNESTSKGLLRALETAGMAGQVKFVGFDAAEVLINGLKENKIQGLAVQNPFKMGYEGVKNAVAAIKKQQVAKTVDTGVQMVTKANLDTPDVHALLTPDLKTWLGE